jgi:hypothetical protein
MRATMHALKTMQSINIKLAGTDRIYFDYLLNVGRKHGEALESTRKINLSSNFSHRSVCAIIVFLCNFNKYNCLFQWHYYVMKVGFF